MLWAYDLSPAMDENMKPIMPDAEKLTQGFVRMPEPFPSRITPRSKERAALVEKEWKEVLKLLEPKTIQWKEIPEGMSLP